MGQGTPGRAVSETPPYTVGDQVVLRSLPGAPLTVLSISSSRINAGRPDRDLVAAPAESFVAAPPGYIGPPPAPIDDQAWSVALYHKAMIDWAKRHAARVSPTAADRYIKSHKSALNRALVRIAGGRITQSLDAPLTVLAVGCVVAAIGYSLLGVL